ncbi:kiSS-1 receptor-like isoform X2 [Biomphalaria glabrata]|uniref:KiSS-1 receptor-like isoform X2 n=2 Tax=Biomphalaria glabrata TaxID=6526 RepID=A0A9W2YV59_BIOGL|nr:kiSS-1 receptor-like isoform X2 [Biomphalaria glabrata]KAI8789059.1 galanin receptor type 2 isoform X1 [Biomphalaria glabrata]
MAYSFQVTTTGLSGLTDAIAPSNRTNHSQPDTFDSFAYKVLVPAVWSIIVLIGVLGNIIVVFTMCKHGGRTMSRSATNCYIINVALADLAFIVIVVPITTAAFVTESWQHGEAMCKFNQYISYVTLLSTCLTLTAMTIDRYFAIVHPIKSMKSRTPRVAVIICIVIWFASSVVCSPYLVIPELRQENGSGIVILVCTLVCSKSAQKALTIVVVLVTYVVPLTVIIVSYSLILKYLWRHKISVRRDFNNSESSEPVMGGGTTMARRRKKVAKMVAAVAILFAITWLPIHLFNLVYVLMDESFPKSKPMYDLKIFAHTLSYTSSCVNPFIYTIMGDGFRRAFRESIPICRGSPSSYQRPSYPRRSGSTIETKFNGE